MWKATKVVVHRGEESRQRLKDMGDAMLDGHMFIFDVYLKRMDNGNVYPQDKHVTISRFIYSLGNPKDYVTDIVVEAEIAAEREDYDDGITFFNNTYGWQKEY